jgi:hypothetical protein
LPPRGQAGFGGASQENMTKIQGVTAESRY